MARREIPEINAGSMADIAFLLLIFFLLTTTMEKDHAYLRRIPKQTKDQKKLDVVQERDVLNIQCNDQGRIQIRGQQIELDKISDWVDKFYLANQKKNIDSEYPYYSRTDKLEIQRKIQSIKTQIDSIKKQGNLNEFVEAKNLELEAWQTKKTALILYGASVLSEISASANIRIEVSELTVYEVFVKIHSEIEESINELRDKEAKRLFKMSYGALKNKNSSDAQALAEKEKLDLLEIIYPARIIELSPKR